MSRVGVIVALVVALVLAAAAVLLLRTPPTASAPVGPLLNLDPARVSEIRVEAPGGGLQVARRVGAGSWVIESAEGGESWPAAGDRIRPALRILSHLEPVRAAERGAEVGEHATVTLSTEDGERHVLRLGTRALAGAVLAEARGEPPRIAWVDASLADMLVGTGMGEWRDRSAMGELGPEVSRITLRSGGRELSLGRVEGRWALLAPIPEAADPDAVARLFALVGQTTVEDFLDGKSPAETGLDSPTAVLTIESDARDPSDTSKVTTIRRRLEVGRIADVAGRNVFARLSGETEFRGQKSGDWSRVVVVNGQPLAEIATEPARYIARKALQTPGSEIGRLEIWGAAEGAGLLAVFNRGLDGWRRMGGAGEMPLAAGDGEGIAGLLELLTGAPAEAVLLQAPPQWTELVRVEIQSLAGMPFARVTLGVGQDGRGIVESDGVWRVYPPAAAGPAVGWASELAGTAAGTSR